jgi:uncharacterized protein (TIGR00251 family)
MVRITPSKGGATFVVKVVPRASRNEIAGTHQDLIRVRLAAPPVEGAANRALVKFLAGVLDVSNHDVEIVAGHTSRRKVIRVVGLSPQEVKTRLLPHLSPP